MRVHEAPPPAKTDVADVARRVHDRALVWLRRHRYLDEHRAEDQGNEPPADTPVDALARLALEGRHVRRPALHAHGARQREHGPQGVAHLRDARRLDLHCAVRIAAGDDEGRERLSRSCARSPFALEVGRCDVARGRAAHRRRVAYLVRPAARRGPARCRPWTSCPPSPRWPARRRHRRAAPAAPRAAGHRRRVRPVAGAGAFPVPSRALECRAPQSRTAGNPRKRAPCARFRSPTVWERDDGAQLAHGGVEPGRVESASRRPGARGSAGAQLVHSDVEPHHVHGDVEPHHLQVRDGGDVAQLVYRSDVAAPGFAASWCATAATCRSSSTATSSRGRRVGLARRRPGARRGGSARVARFRGPGFGKTRAA